MSRPPEHRKPKQPSANPATDNTGMVALNHPVFGQPQPTDDPSVFRVHHASDSAAYKKIDELNKEHKLAALPFPPPRGLPEPRLTLAQVFGNDTAAVQAIEATGQLVFHAAGDTGSTRGPETQSLVADKMLTDFDEQHAKDKPSLDRKSVV